MEKWMVAAKRADFKGIGERFGIDQVTARIIRNRDVIGEKAIEKYRKSIPVSQLVHWQRCFCFPA